MYPDLGLIKTLRSKFLTYSVRALSESEIIDLINHQHERIHDLEKAASQPAVQADAAKCPLDGGGLDDCHMCNKNRVCYVLHRTT